MNKSSKHFAAVDTIQKKLLGKKITYKEIFNLMDEISKNRLNEVLTTYFVASSFKEGYTALELYYFTKAMVETGNRLKFKGIVADKHSTGGVAGTRTTMIIVPIIAAAGFTIPKISSRAITTPAGTADVMEVLARVDFNTSEITEVIHSVGGCIVWNGNLRIAPADDIIIRVEEQLSFESFDKIIMSVTAKKVAVSATHLVLDIPIGPTMKIRHFQEGEKVARKFKDLAHRFGIKVTIDINETLEPAGNGVGPALEARDVLYVLEQKNVRSMKLESKALRLAGKLLDICYSDTGNNKSGEDEARSILKSGAALKKFKEIIKAQKGNPDISSESLKIRSHSKYIVSDRKGKIKGINNFHLNSLAKIVGAPLDKFAGIYLLKKLDERVEKHEPIYVLYSSDSYKLKEGFETSSFLPIYSLE